MKSGKTAPGVTLGLGAITSIGIGAVGAVGAMGMKAIPIGGARGARNNQQFLCIRNGILY